MEERKNLLRWIKEHKKILIATGIGIGALILIILGIKNRESVQAAWEMLRRAVKKPNVATSKTIATASATISRTPPLEELTIMEGGTNTLPFEVSRHIRTLPKGQHASPEKVAQALMLNITLMDGQTWVDGYMKGGPAA